MASGKHTQENCHKFEDGLGYILRLTKKIKKQLGDGNLAGIAYIMRLVTNTTPKTPKANNPTPH